MKRFLRTAILCTSLSAVVLLNTGCVFWRLNQFRSQLSTFSENFRIEDRDVPTIVALNPMLKPDDLGWLSGLAASETKKQEGRTTEYYRYIKTLHPEDVAEPGEYDLLIPLHFNADDRLIEIQAPARFGIILTEQNFNEVFGPMMDGTVERARQSTGWFWEQHRVNIPTRTDIEYFFGHPTRIEESEAGPKYVYGYLLEGNDERWNPTGFDVYAEFLFEPEEERVIYSESYKGRLNITVDLREETKRVEIRRL